MPQTPTLLLRRYMITGEIGGIQYIGLLTGGINIVIPMPPTPQSGETKLPTQQRRPPMPELVAAGFTLTILYGVGCIGWWLRDALGDGK